MGLRPSAPRRPDWETAIGLLCGAPVGNILSDGWQETFLALGDLWLVLIIFEGFSLVPLDIYDWV